MWEDTVGPATNLTTSGGYEHGVGSIRYNDSFCSSYLDDYYNNASQDYATLSIYVTLFFFSIAGLIFVAQTIFYNVKLQTHPQLVIAYICMAEAMMSYNALIQVIGPVYVTCYFGMDQVLSWTLFKGEFWHKDSTISSFQCATNLLCNTNALFFQFFQLLSLMLNFFLCVDLIKTIQSPFTPAGSRTKFYYLASAVVPFVMILVIHIINTVKNSDEPACTPCIQQYTSTKYIGTMITGFGNYVLSFVMSCYILSAIYSVIFAYRRLNRPGVSQEIRSMFLQKHYVYVAVFLAIWIIQLSQNYYQLFNPPAPTPGQEPETFFQYISEYKVHSLDYLAAQLGFRGPIAQAESSADSKNGFFVFSSVMTFSTGIFLTGARLFEPFFRYTILVKYYQFYGEMYQETGEISAEQRTVQKEALSGFLSSSLNVELVYTILESITTFVRKDGVNELNFTIEQYNRVAKGRSKVRANIVPISMDLEVTRLTEQVEDQKDITRTLNLSQIVIKDVDKWDTAKTKDFMGNNQGASQTAAQEQNNTLTINEEVKTIEYAPAVFQAIRQMDGITDEMVQQSLDTERNRDQVFKAKESAGKSGSFFFFCYDRRFLIKTMNDNEMAVFMKALPDYFNHCRLHPDSILARIYGVYTVMLEELVPVHILLMANSAQVKHKMNYCFDLKGSMINREVKAKDIKPGGTLKDVNLLNICKNEQMLLFRKQDIRTLMSQIIYDSRFLQKYNLMDYSLLVIVETNKDWDEQIARRKTRAKPPQQEGPADASPLQRQRSKSTKQQISQQIVKTFDEEKRGNRHKYISVNGQFIYHVAIIDYLQEFNLEKKAENFIKVWVYNREEYRISAVNQDMYRSRFFKFMKDSVVINQSGQEIERQSVLQGASGTLQKLKTGLLLKLATKEFERQNTKK